VGNIFHISTSASGNLVRFMGGLRNIAKSDCQLRLFCLSLCPFVRTEQLGFHWKDFH